VLLIMSLHLSVSITCLCVGEMGQYKKWQGKENLGQNRVNYVKRGGSDHLPFEGGMSILMA